MHSVASNMFLRILIITISFLFLTTTTFAQTKTSTQSLVTSMSKGDKAPFSGTLLNPAAVARILAEKEYAKKECNINLEYEKNLLIAKCNRDTSYLQRELEIEKSKYNSIVSAQKEEIETLRNLAKGSDSTLWAVVGFTLGAATSIAIFFAATEIAK